MNLDDSLQQLFRRNLHVMKLDLEPMQALLGLLNHPHRELVCVHIAGSNGKGSVAAMMEAILRAQGYRTGLYTSPHLVRFNERIQINREAIDDVALRACILEVEAAAARLPARGIRDVTFFEFTTALAFLHLARQKVDVAVIETGMGGRLDATNVMVPALSIITSISLEHTAYLGDTLGKIAFEKAGIIKKARPVIVGRLPEEAIAVIREKARTEDAPLHIAAEYVSATPQKISMQGQKAAFSSTRHEYGTLTIGLGGFHQVGNAAVAIAASECLDQEVGIPVSTEAIRGGLASVRWPARLQMLETDPAVVLDGAHNPEAGEALALWLKKAAGRKPVGMIVSFLSDKDPAAFMQHFRGLVQRLWLVPIHNERAMPVAEMRHRIGKIPFVDTCDDVRSALRMAKKWGMDEKGLVLVAGSLYLAGEILQLYAEQNPETKEAGK